MFELFQETKDYYGKIIYADRFLYRHYGIGTHDNRVIHFNYGDSSNTEVIESSLDAFANGCTVKECSRTSPSYSPTEIVSRARSKLYSDFGGYDLSNNNCEHFAVWCATGKRSSTQVFFKNDDKDIVEKAIDLVFEPGMIVCKKIDDVIDGCVSIFSGLFK